VSDPSTPVCQQRLLLIRDYRETTRTYADLVHQMSELVGCGLEAEVDLLRKSCRTAYERAEQARLALARHETDHSCNRSDFQGKSFAAGSSGR
jgi:hypothetical protein